MLPLRSGVVMIVRGDDGVIEDGHGDPPSGARLADCTAVFFPGRQWRYPFGHDG
jgi:hypothetical protein